MRPALFANFVPRLANVASQVLVAMVATGLASSLFGGMRTPAPAEQAPAGKHTARIADAEAPGVSMALYPQDIAALTSIERFRPLAFTPAAPEPAKAFAAPQPRTREAAVLPPPRPKALAAQPTAVAAAAQTEPAAAPEAPRKLVIAGFAIPTPSLDIKSLAPNGETLTGAVDKAKSAVDWLVHVAVR